MYVPPNGVWFTTINIDDSSGDALAFSRSEGSTFITTGTDQQLACDECGMDDAIYDEGHGLTLSFFLLTGGGMVEGLIPPATLGGCRTFRKYGARRRGGRRDREAPNFASAHPVTTPRPGASPPMRVVASWFRILTDRPDTRLWRDWDLPANCIFAFSYTASEAGYGIDSSRSSRSVMKSAIVVYGSRFPLARAATRRSHTMARSTIPEIGER
jgi:hypothetical protein